MKNERKERGSSLLVGLEACVCRCAQLVISGASVIMLSCELAEVGLRGDRLKREVGTTGATNESCAHASAHESACTCACECAQWMAD